MVEVIVGAAVLVGLVVGGRVARALGALRTAKRCEVCGRSEPSTHLRFFRNTGMLIMFRSETLSKQMCRRCATQAFLRMTVWTMVLGWWGLISFFLNFVFIALNFGHFFWALTLPSGAAVSRSRLVEHREYALNLLATKDFETVVDVISKTAGASPADTEKFLRSLEAEGQLSGSSS